MRYYITKGLKNKRRKNTMTYLTQQEKRSIYLDCGERALVLYEFYVSKQNVPEYDFSDSKASEATGLSLRKVQDTRRVLEKAGYFKLVKDHNTQIVYIGKDKNDVSV